MKIYLNGEEVRVSRREKALMMCMLALIAGAIMLSVRAMAVDSECWSTVLVALWLAAGTATLYVWAFVREEEGGRR